MKIYKMANDKYQLTPTEGAEEINVKAPRMFSGWDGDVVFVEDKNGNEAKEIAVENGVIYLVFDNGNKVELKIIEPKKMFHTTGETYRARGNLKQHGFVWNSKEKYWVGNEEQKNAFEYEANHYFETLPESKKYMTNIKFVELKK